MYVNGDEFNEMANSFQAVNIFPALTMNLCFQALLCFMSSCFSSLQFINVGKLVHYQF